MGRLRRSSLGVGYVLANAAAWFLVLLILWLRYGAPAASVLPGGLGLSALAAALLVLPAWFSDHPARRKRWLHGSNRRRKRARKRQGNHNRVSTSRSS